MPDDRKQRHYDIRGYDAQKRMPISQYRRVKQMSEYDTLEGRSKFRERFFTQQLAQVLEAILRAHGGALAVYDGALRGLSGDLVVREGEDGRGEQYVIVTTLSRAEGKWNPAEAPPIIKDDIDLAAYVDDLLDAGVTTIRKGILKRYSKYDHEMVNDVLQAVREELKSEMETRKRAKQDRKELDEATRKVREAKHEGPRPRGRRRFTRGGQYDPEQSQDGDERSEQGLGEGDAPQGE